MFVVTGNRLLDGVVVFLAPAKRWDGDLQQARCFADKAEAVAALEDEEIHASVVSLDVVAVTQSDDGVVVADRLREKIRADGPTIQPFTGMDFGKRFGAQSRDAQSGM